MPLSQGITPAFFVASSQSGLFRLPKQVWPEIAFVISQKKVHSGTKSPSPFLKIWHLGAQIAFALRTSKFLLTESPCTQCICAHTQCISRAYAIYFAVHTQCIFRARALYFCAYATWPTLHTRAYATCLHCACTARVCNAGGPPIPDA